jgi:hypothetical protein
MDFMWCFWVVKFILGECIKVRKDIFSKNVFSFTSKI